MKIYVVLDYMAFEGQRVRAVFTTLEDAKNFIEENREGFKVFSGLPEVEVWVADKHIESYEF